MKKWILWTAVVSVLLASFALGIHNASIYMPNHGFDGAGHVYYVKYIAKHWQIPPPASEWETHQPPLYYFLGALIMSAFGTFRAVHYINIFILWAIIGMVGFVLRKVFKDKYQVLLGMLSLAALPMLNIFPPMITNELLSTFWIISAAVASLYLTYSKTKRQITWVSVWLGASLILGVWTKISIITILPTVAVAVIISAIRNKGKRKPLLISGVITLVLFILAATPIFLRGAQTQSPSNVIRTVSGMKNASRPLSFFYRLDWIPKVDMYTTQYYSFLGGAWNSFWNDGHNVITPFIKFHKKAFVLWSLGFVLLPFSLYGIWLLWKKNKDVSLIINTIGISMLGMYLFYNIVSNHYSAVRLTYEMGVVVPYAFGIAAATYSKKCRVILLLILSVQFAILISFFWILSWWNVAR